MVISACGVQLFEYFYCLIAKKFLKKSVKILRGEILQKILNMVWLFCDFILVNLCRKMLEFEFIFSCSNYLICIDFDCGNLDFIRDIYLPSVMSVK